MKNTNLMIVGVGGQGALLASKLLGKLLLDEGHDVKISEVHGMSQRGGSVVTYVRFGEKVYSPVVCDGEADFIISFEKLEAGRYVKSLKKGGVIITNSQRIDPMPVIVGAAEYPEEILSDIKEKNITLDVIDAISLADEAGSSKAVNIVLMGRVSKYFDIPKEKWLDAIKGMVKPAFVEMNLKAFELGYNATSV